MSARWLKSKATHGLNIGLTLFVFGILIFFLFEDTKLEKFGLFLMAFGGMMVGMGYTAYIAFKTR